MMDYQSQILAELEKEKTTPRRNDGKPNILDLMNYCGVPFNENKMSVFRDALHSLVNTGQIVRVCTKVNGLGECVAGYYQLADEN